MRSDFEQQLRNHWQALDFSAWNQTYSLPLSSSKRSSLKPPPPGVDGFYLHRDQLNEQEAELARTTR